MFREGALVTALREGHWLVLDELNLAPTEVLEALNRWGGRREGGVALISNGVMICEVWLMCKGCVFECVCWMME